MTTPLNPIFPTRNIINVSADTTLTTADNESLVQIVEGAGAVTITLPVITATSNQSLNFLFIISTAAAGNAVINPGAGGSLKGVCLSPTANVTSGGTAHLNFIGGTGVVGDYANVFSSGNSTSWSVFAVSKANAGVTLT